jgi:N-acetylglucosaminyldiphosphoundecaprenol N-acetyl-beta-D-mannosaminyltransferase
MQKRIPILGIDFDDISFDDAVKTSSAFLKGGSTKTIYTPNPEFILNARKDQNFKEILNKGDLVLCDGIGVILCSRILKRPIKERVRGIDLIKALLERSEKTPFSLFILGSSEENCRIAALKIKENYPGADLLGFQNGYYRSDEEPEIIERINQLNPDLLMVALGSPRQEKFISDSRLKNFGCAIGVGGTVDVLSGNVRLAPPLLRKLGLEWLYRLIREPKRAGRMLKLPLVLLYALHERIKG